METGDLPSLLAVMMQTTPGEVRLWIGRYSHERTYPREWADARCDAFGLGSASLIDLGPLLDEGARDGLSAEGPRLLRAAADALAIGARRLVWPVVVGPDPDDAGTILELASAVADVATIGVAGPDDLVIDAPFVDRELWELVDLAQDMAAPLALVRPCHDARRSACGTCSNCAPWRRAFEAAAVPWPWSDREATSAGTTI